MTKYKFIVYVISGGLAAAAGVFIIGRTALGTPLNAIQRKTGQKKLASSEAGFFCLVGESVRLKSGRYERGSRPESNLAVLPIIL